MYKWNVRPFGNTIDLEEPGKSPEWRKWIRPIPQNWYDSNNWWWKTIPVLGQAEYYDADGTPIPILENPDALGAVFTNDQGTQITQKIGTDYWEQAMINAFPLRKYYYFGLNKSSATGLEQLKSTLENVQQ